MEVSSQKKEMLIEFLQCAARGDMEEILTILMCHPDLINAEHSESGDTALIVAARENQPEVIAILLNNGADVTLRNSSCQTALHVANDAIRAHLLSAVKRTSYPQLALAQAAWQGDLDTIQDLLSADSCQDVNTVNVQGLTPLMLVVRDVDLFEGLTMESKYKPLSVLEELLRHHHGDAHLLDLNGNSAMSFASQVKSPIRQQLMDLLEKSPPPPETLDKDFCGFCPDTKPSLFDRTASTLDTPDSQNTNFGKEPLCDGIIVEDISQEPEAEVPICPEAGGAGGAPVYDLEKNTMDERKKNFLPAQRLPDFSPEHLTSRPSIRKNPSLPPLYVKKDKKDVQLERLGLGYLLKGSHSDPNTPEAQSAVDPLRNLRYIKEHIRQRLSSSELPGSSKTFPPIYYSPLSPKSYRLRPLPKSSSSSITERSITILNSEMFDKSRDNRCKHGSVQKSVDGLDMVLSKDQVQVSLVSVTSSESGNHTSDLSKSAHSSIRIASGRREDKDGLMSHDNTSLPQICCRLPELHTNDKTPRSSWKEKTHSSFESQPLAVQKNHKTVKDAHNDSKDNELVTNCDQDLLKDKTDLLHSSMTNKNSKDNIKMALNDNRLPYVSKVIESIKNNSPRTHRASNVPFVQITFSEQEAETEVHYPPVKQSLVKGKPNLSILTHVSRSFNINALKEHDKSKKTKNIRNNSATNLKFSRPLSNSNRNCGKCVPLPTLAYSSGPSPSRMSKKGRPKPGSAERSSQRSKTQLSLYTKKRPKSPVNPAMPLRAKSAHDFQDIHYSDMFAEIKSQNNGPGIFQMFESAVYIKSSKEYRRSCKEASSASSTRSCSSKGIRSGSSRESSARSSKSAKPGNRKKSSATSSRRKNLTKSVAAEEISEKNRDNQVIISGTDWEIKAIKEEKNVNEIITDKLPNNIPDLPHQDFSDLSIIKEATIENSLTGNQAAQTTFIKMFQEVGKVKHTENLKKEQVGLVTPEEGNGIETLVPQAKTKSSGKDEEQISEAGDFGLPPQMISATRRPSGGLQLSLGNATLNNLNSREKNEEEIFTEDSERERSHQLNSTSIPMNSRHNSGTSDLLISFKRCLEQIDQQSKNSKTVENHQAYDQSANIDSKQHAEKSGRKINTIQISRCTSPKDRNTNNSNQSGNYFSTNNDSSIYWIKGEVLGRGAYGTVYKGLTSQGELIAAKQVMLHASDSDVAEKEYKKLQEEVDLLKTLKHDNIVGYLGTCLQDNIVTIFMEFVPGGSIANILRDFGPLQEVVISKFTNHILQGIGYLHKNRVVHRDIKGNNVMLMPNGVIKLIDFGCAKRLNGLSMNGSRREMLKSMHGTPYWMAPEVISESGHGEKSDIWSIGCTVFEMATGKPPLAHMNRLAAMFYIAGHKGFMPTLPDHFSKKARDFVNLCLIREQEERPSAEQLLQHSFTREKTPPQKSFQPPEDA